MPNVDMLINSVPGEECRIAIVEDGRLEELYHERASAESHVGNIYQGRVLNVEPSIQAAFVDFGRERNGFLHISDLHPMYFPGAAREEFERVGMRTPRRARPPIQKCLHRGQNVLVQVLKTGIGTKGPTLTSYLSIPGRFLVMMPHMERLGVSRKIEDDELRRKMRQMLDELDPPDDFGFIIRTAGMDRTKAELKRDLAYLQRLWKTIDRRRKQVDIGELYTESNLVIRTIRDVFTSDIQRVIVDHPVAAKRAADFLAIASPRSSSQVFHYRDSIPLFDRFDVERQIDNIHAKQVPLPSGGSLVIESTEALVAIDVNSGRMRDNRDAETTAFKTNMEAADEICRQLRLRDLGGVVVNDLIDMRDSKHRRAIEQQFRDNLRKDRARTRVLTISQFGILEMTRQRIRPGITSSVYSTCTQCGGTGTAKTSESLVLDVMRQLSVVLSREDVAKVQVAVSADVAFQLLNRRRTALVSLEAQHHKSVMVRVNDHGPADLVSLTATDARGGVIDIDAPAKWGEPTLVNVGFEDSSSPEEPPPAQEQPAASRATAPAPATKPDESDGADQPSPAKPSPRRRSTVKRSRTSKSTASTAPRSTRQADSSKTDQPDAEPAPPAEAKTDAPQDATASKGRRRRRRGGRGRSRKKAAAGAADSDKPAAAHSQSNNNSPPASNRPTGASHGYHNRVKADSGKTSNP